MLCSTGHLDPDGEGERSEKDGNGFQFCRNAWMGSPFQGRNHWERKQGKLGGRGEDFELWEAGHCLIPLCVPKAHSTRPGTKLS